MEVGMGGIGPTPRTPTGEEGRGAKESSLRREI